MRRQMLLAAALVAAVTAAAPPSVGYAQSRRDPEADQRRQQEDAAKKRRQREEWGDVQAPLPALRNAGPCPYVKTLYDAARYVEFKDNREASANVGWSGEIQGISSGCAYKDNEPIQVVMEVLFELGKGPQAAGRSKTYRYWVAVTDRNRSVLAKEWFDLPVDFPEGSDRVHVTEEIEGISIPRAAMTTSGANFEVLIGFEVTPEMAAFNRDGKRFRLNVGQSASASTNP
ncbi:MAG: Tat pathway signal sequence domain protein [Phenylobacterium sp.]|nr:Tat pathway signal sequence domain protein [Phenylobacterium sp.]